ncbi:hypothetical protein CAF53_24110 [Sphingobium sp. LB126]|nr:hypothetical protein CAF53_24110 [Sphingobium sp. LB126]
MPRALEMLAPPCAHRAGQNRWHRGHRHIAERRTIAPGEPQDQGGPAHGKAADHQDAGRIDFSFQPSLDRNRILALAGLDFINRAEVVHLLGPPGTGKKPYRHCSCSRGREGGQERLLHPLADLIASLTKAEREGTLRERIRFLCRSALLVVDEIGYLPVTPGGGNLFFQLVNARYEKGAMILTSNRGFAEWGDVFGDPVVARAARPPPSPRGGHPDRGLQLSHATAR